MRNLLKPIAWLSVTFLLVFNACSGKQDNPVEAAIAAKATESMTDASFKLYTLELIDSTTIGVELDRRIETLNLRLKQNYTLEEKYRKEGKRLNAEKKLQDIENDRENITKAYALRESLAGSLNDVAYYDYKFSGQAKSKEAVMNYKDAYATVTPDFKVLTLSARQEDLHKGTGAAIPGYKEIFENN